MKSRFIFLFTLTAGCLAFVVLQACSRHSASEPAQSAPPQTDEQPPAAQQPPAAPPPAAAQNTPASLDPLEQLVAPIALYPDPLIALLLPASTVPADLAKAAQYLSGSGDPSQVDSQPWDSSVRGLAHYPNVLEWMAQNQDWTQALGAAFASRPADVMTAIQHLRAMAKAAGTLANTPQQDVVDEDGAIAIEPAQPDMIYVPSYDPDVVFVEDPYYGYYGPYMTFGVGFPIGFWLGYGFDWGHGAIWFGNWHNWYNHGGWNHPVFPGQHGYIAAANAGQWRPSANVQVRASVSLETTAVRPRPMSGAPRAPDPRTSVRTLVSPPRISMPSAPAPRIDDREQFRESAPPERTDEHAPDAAPRFVPEPEHSGTAPPHREQAPPHREERQKDREPR